MFVAGSNIYVAFYLSISHDVSRDASSINPHCLQGDRAWDTIDLELILSLEFFYCFPRFNSIDA